MPKVTCFYIDDSGTRNPDRKLADKPSMDWFALGGVMINEEDEPIARQAHAAFLADWGIDYPLHSSEIRQRQGNFKWLQNLRADDYCKFMTDLTNLIVEVPVIGHACVIDRPGYDNRYREKYGRQTWMLCQTAFTVVVERAAKIAGAQGRKLRVFPEATDKKADDHIRRYYREMKASGMQHFSEKTSAAYNPLTSGELSDTLYELAFKRKTSPMAQLADLFLYPLARFGYQPDYRPHKILLNNGKVIDQHLTKDLIDSQGVKYSCFELVEPKKTKAKVSLGFRQPPPGTS